MTGLARPGPAGGASDRLRRWRRVALGTAAAVILACLVAVGVQMGRSDGGRPPVEVPALPRADALQRPAPPSAGPRPGHPVMAGPGWRVVSVNSISGVLMVTVETERFGEMSAIAREVLAPATAELLEALVYFHRPGTSDAVGRVQWTPRAGYVPLRFGDP
jgi:hypothetical protein